MKIATILGSLVKNGSCTYALKIVQDELLLNDSVEIVKIEPADFDLPFPGLKEKQSESSRLKSLLENVDGVVIATPEYHGSFSSVVKLVIENLGFPSVLSGKPISLLGVAGGSIGAIKSLEQLRSVCSHVGAIVLPGPVSIAKVRSVFDSEGNCKDKKVETRLKNLANELIRYTSLHVYPVHTLEELVREEN